uniref:Uncharacterized protein n=1 Tax=Rhizophora mucronata TaxID=61149 RepID=A0A2P2N0Y6_RHIMU
MYFCASINATSSFQASSKDLEYNLSFFLTLFMY